MIRTPDRMRRVCFALLAGALVLLAPAFPQSALADDVPNYSVVVVPYSGVYCDGITVWAGVDEEGTYYIAWNSPLISGAITDVYAPSAGNYSAQFAVPEAPRSTSTMIHKVFLISSDNSKLAEAVFEVFPTVDVDPKQGPAGSAIIIKGYGFSAGETNIPVKFDGTQVATANANANGSWTISYTIPNRPSGSYVLNVGPDSVTEELWHTHITVTPKITVSPSSGVAGQLIDVTGAGFASNEKSIRITFDGEVVKDDISADASGSWSAEIPVPRLGSGTYQIGASGFSTWARDVPPVNFTVETGVSASPNEVYVGDEVSVMGSGFAAWETGIRVTFAGQTVETGSITADRYGTWEASFVVPTSTFGDKVVSASGDKTTAAAVRTATVKVLARIEVNPLEGSPGDSVTLTGSGFPGDQALTVTFANRAVPETVRSLANGNLSAVVTVPASPTGKLSVTTTGGGAQASTDFTVTEKILPTPQPVSPEEGRRLRSGEVTFKWGRIMGNAGGITYTLEITGPGGSRVITDIEGPSYTIPDEERLQKGDYTWQVKAIDEFGNESLLSDPSPFRVSPIPTWVWVIVGLVVFTTLMTVAYREGRFKVTE